jgi:hypothetical protein
VGKGYSRVNMVQILCTHVRKWRNEICWNCSIFQEWRDKGEWWRGEFKMIYLVYCKKYFCKCHYVPPAEQYKKRKKYKFVQFQFIMMLLKEELSVSFCLSVCLSLSCFSPLLPNSLPCFSLFFLDKIWHRIWGRNLGVIHVGNQNRYSKSQNQF